MSTKKDNPSVKLIVLTVFITLLVGGGGAYFLGYLGHPPSEIKDTSDHAGSAGVSGTSSPSGTHSAKEDPGEKKPERKVLYWRAPMNPTEIYDKPGKSRMGMDLVPVYEDEVAGGVEVKIDPVTEQNMGIRTAHVEKGHLTRVIRTYGHVTYDETRTAQISPKFSGWIEKLHVDFTGQFVKKGEPLFAIYSPELVTAQEEYLVAYRNLSQIPGDSGRELLESAKRRLLYWDVPEEEIRAIAESGKIRKALVIDSPFNGVVITKNAVEGTYVKEGTVVYQIADLSTVWVEAHIFEYELPWIELGKKVEMTLPYMPGRAYNGKVSYIYPYLQRKTRDVVIRLEFPNPDLELKPDMYADILVKADAKGEGLIIPSEAVLRSGQRDVVFVARGEGKFSPREVQLGLTLENGRIQVLSGLKDGEMVVTSGQFLLDSESKLREAVQKMMEAKKDAPGHPIEETESKPQPPPPAHQH